MNHTSVCMTVCNGEKYIRQQIDSILPQLLAEDELIISDDGSTDNSLALIQEYTDPRIRILPPKKFGNPSSNFEYVLQASSHNHIFISDQDDFWYPDKIRKMKDELTHADLIVCDSRILQKSAVLHPSFFAYNKSRAGLWPNLLKSSYMGCCMAFHKKILEKAVPFPQNGVMYDHWIGLIADKYFKVHFMNEILVDHYRHGKNYTTTGDKTKNSFLIRLKMRLRLLNSLLRR